jgi:L-lactate dehydrogenase complex protein LldG
MVAAPMSGETARTAILARIARALAGEPRTELPEPLEIFPGARVVDRRELALTFRDELAKLGGETRFVAREEDLAPAIAAFVGERGFGAASVDYETADYALLRAEALIADTGSAVVIERSTQRRLAPYLPRTCIIVGDAAALYPRMERGALEPIFAAARRADRGEGVIVTGPSRTADIEKTVVLGAHGPRDVVVFIVGIGGEGP